MKKIFFGTFFILCILMSVRTIQADFLDVQSSHPYKEAIEFVKVSKSIVILKGAGTIVTDGQQIFINKTGNPGMATGGTGDVLTGCIAALLARQGEGAMSALDAAILGVYVHGQAGDLAGAVMGQTALIATDLLDWLVQAWKILE